MQQRQPLNPLLLSCASPIRCAFQLIDCKPGTSYAAGGPSPAFTRHASSRSGRWCCKAAPGRRKAAVKESMHRATCLQASCAAVAEQSQPSHQSKLLAHPQCKQHSTTRYSQASSSSSSPPSSVPGGHARQPTSNLLTHRTRRLILGAVALSPLLPLAKPARADIGVEHAAAARRTAAARVPEDSASRCASMQRMQPVDWAGPGPMGTIQLPRLEHTCSSCFPLCVGDRCLLRIDVTYPKVRWTHVLHKLTPALAMPDAPGPPCNLRCLWLWVE